MTFWLKDNEQANAIWINISKVLKYSFWLAFVARGIIRMIDNVHYKDNVWFNMVTYVALGFGLLNLILNFVHWVKPKWFENENKQYN